MSESFSLTDARPQPSPFYRWAVLVIVSVAMAGNYYIYDSINPLERILLDQLHFSASMFGWLNASYSVAAVATLLIGGIIIDRVGIRKSLLFFSTLCLLGAILTALERQLLAHGGWPHHAGPGSGIADRSGVRRRWRAGSRARNSASPSASTSRSPDWRRLPPTIRRRGRSSPSIPTELMPSQAGIVHWC